MILYIYAVIIYVEIKYQELCTAGIRMGSQPPQLQQGTDNLGNRWVWKRLAHHSDALAFRRPSTNRNNAAGLSAKGRGLCSVQIGKLGVLKTKIRTWKSHWFSCHPCHHDGLYMVTVTHRNPPNSSSFTIPAAVSAGSRSVPVPAGSQPDRLCGRWRWANTRSRATSSWNDPLRWAVLGVGGLGGPGKLSPKPKYHWETPQQKPGTNS